MRRKNGVGKAIKYLESTRAKRNKELEQVHDEWDWLIEEAKKELEEICDHFYLVKHTIRKFAEWPEGGWSKEIYVCPDCKKQFDWSPPWEEDGVDWIEIDVKKKLYKKVRTKPRQNYLE